jgi:rhodanese-related sulfurtransferase
MKKGYKELLKEAEAKITAISPETAAGLLKDPNVVFVDIRDIRELTRDGMIPGALHAPRGMLEFWVDPESPYHKPLFASGKKFVFYCASGWRSALATQTVLEMGLSPVCHLAGGFSAWKKAGFEVSDAPKPKEERSS